MIFKMFMEIALSGGDDYIVGSVTDEMNRSSPPEKVGGPTVRVETAGK